MSIDRFGVPDSVFGTHDEDFYSAIGRIAGLSALIEHQTFMIYQTMMNLPQNADTQLGAGQLIEKACKALAPVGEDENKKILFQYFTDVETALRKRNDYIHNLWPAQPGDQFFGWRPNRDKETRVDQPYLATQTNMDEFKASILTLVELVQRRDRAYVSACALQELKLRVGAML
ncbi:hypothetical protein [Psychromicrobium xiongbiense]|uniref:hypothetical protein n=1 Tax=Psychromicrobium xiongbiense TaxID=3051184 RepID=UPI0025576B4B|nr:hypothetical protein [Psychromicrobium sp. YIM S02556]